jgi:hypothetical protein
VREKVDEAFGDRIGWEGDEPCPTGLVGSTSVLRFNEDVEAPSSGWASVSEERGDLAARPRESEEKRPVGFGSAIVAVALKSFAARSQRV